MRWDASTDAQADKEDKVYVSRGMQGVSETCIPSAQSCCILCEGGWLRSLVELEVGSVGEARSRAYRCSRRRRAQRQGVVAGLDQQQSVVQRLEGIAPPVMRRRQRVAYQPMPAELHV